MGSVFTTTRKRTGVIEITQHIHTFSALVAAPLAMILGFAAPLGLAEGDDEEIPFDEAEIFFELNNTDGDLGIHALIDAASTLADIGTGQAANALATALSDEDPGVREEAVEALADIGGERSAHALATALRDENAALREEAVYALGNIGGETAAHLLRQVLMDHNSSIRDAAVEILAEPSSGAQ